MNNIWTPAATQGGQLVENISKQNLVITTSGTFIIPPSTIGILLPEIKATRQFPDEEWRIRAAASFSIDQGSGDINVAVGIWRGAQPPPAVSLDDPRVLSVNRFYLDRSTSGTRLLHEYSDSVWVKPPPIGVEQAFSIYILFITATGTAQMRTYDTSEFSIERFRKGPWHKNVDLRVHFTTV